MIIVRETRIRRRLDEALAREKIEKPREKHGKTKMQHRTNENPNKELVEPVVKPPLFQVPWLPNTTLPLQAIAAR